MEKEKEMNAALKCLIIVAALPLVTICGMALFILRPFESCTDEDNYYRGK